ncbi:MAG: 2-succinyl-5-enolpyruvyl-6-hydroxy-3-cyclohexene-1-carboxylic-acid synthase, partial [Bacteroidaceae bacterium]|nr:2-succinyl-5-enolpyruvyl-6-hydroxy-3-cyclohexene-1-carboxylic-acid synthase [Bacteroidaceae bacterium]
MYSHKLNVNILTAVLLAHGIEEAVVCPGSRNAPLVHNLHATQRIRLHSVVDERSAAFVAIGLYLQTRRPVVVCVTSGSAVLNTLPGVAEAALRHIPLLIISADRPPEWIGQLDGQTLPQTNALHPYAPCFTLVEPHTADQQWWCERVANEAILATAQRGGQPVQINVPLSEPLLQCTTNELPTVRKIEQFRPQSKHPLPEHIVAQIAAAQCPVLVIGQWEEGGIPAVDQLRQRGQLLVYSEDLSQQGDSHTADWLDKGEVSPDLVIHIGGAMVSKHFKLFLRRLENCPVVRISTNEELPDTFCHLQSHVIASPQAALAQLAEQLPTKPAVVALAEQIAASAPEARHYPQLEAIFLGNSMAVRWGNRFFARTAHPIYGNRGTNGIEGSLSVAA